MITPISQPVRLAGSAAHLFPLTPIGKKRTAKESR